MTLTWKDCNLPNKMIWLQITKTPKYQRINTTDEGKNKQIDSQIKIRNEHLKNIPKVKKYKKLNMTEHKTDMNITKIKKYKKIKHDGAQNRPEHY